MSFYVGLASEAPVFPSDPVQSFYVGSHLPVSSRVAFLVSDLACLACTAQTEAVSTPDSDPLSRLCPPSQAGPERSNRNSTKNRRKLAKPFRARNLEHQALNMRRRQ